MTQPTFSDKFSDNLAQLPTAGAIAAIELTDRSEMRIGRIENKPGQAGSVRGYAWLAKTFGAITPEAAEWGLKIYAEHTADARANPGKHPNIDRLFSIRAPNQTLQATLVAATTNAT